MGKTAKWIKSFLTGKKAKENSKGGNTSNEDSSFSNEIPPPQTPLVIPPNTPKEKRRWSFRRSASGGKKHNSIDLVSITPRSVRQSIMESQKKEHKQQHSLVVPATTTDEVVKDAEEEASSAIRLAAASNRRRTTALKEAAATMIQAFFRSYLARKALCALKGLVKLQALVRGHLVRKQAVTTLRCMQALVNVQTRTRAQRIQVAEEAQLHSQRSSNYRTSPQHNRYKQTDNMGRHMEDKIKVVEMDMGVSRGSRRRRNSYSDNNQVERAEQGYSPHYHAQLNQDYYYQMSPAPSALPDMRPKVCSAHFDQYSLSTEQSSPYCYSSVSKQDPLRVPCTSPQPYVDSVYDHTLFPNYMAKTESFKAKARSQSAPKQRTDLFERQLSRKKALVEGRSVPHSIRMQRSSSRVGTEAQGKQFPWSVKLDRSAISLMESECGSTSTILTNTNYCRSLAAYEVNNY